VALSMTARCAGPWAVFRGKVVSSRKQVGSARADPYSRQLSGRDSDTATYRSSSVRAVEIR
jgi:hypothetical protein